MQVCVTSPALAPWAQIPLALAAGIEHAPEGAAQLVKTAITLGADAAALSPIAAGMPNLDHVELPEQVELLSPRPEAVKAEEALVAELTELGVRFAEWAPPANMKAPKGNPSAAVDGALKTVAMRSVNKARRAGTFRGDKALQFAAPVDGIAQVVPVVATPARAEPARRASEAAEIQAKMEVETQAAPRGMKRMYGKTKAASLGRDAGDVE